MAISQPSNKIQLFNSEEAGENSDNNIAVMVSGDNIMVSLSDDSYNGGTVSLYSMDGKKIAEQTLSGSNISLGVDVPNGAYMVQVEKNSLVLNKKILIGG